MCKSNQFSRTVNWHFVNACNMSCRYCFIPRTNELSLDESFEILEKLKGYFTRINFVGGEPTVSSKLIPLVQKAKDLGFIVSMVTNGYELYHKPELFDEILPSFSIIGISVDSLNPESNLTAGRKVGKSVMSQKSYIELCKKIKLAGCKLKINTVVNKLNVNEDFNDFYKTVSPDRIKLFQVLKPAGELKQNYDDLLITEEEFTAFLNRHSGFSRIICSENNELMLNSYYILNSEGCFFDNKTGVKSNSLKYCNLETALGQVTVDTNKYEKRYA